MMLIKGSNGSDDVDVRLCAAVGLRYMDNRSSLSYSSLLTVAQIENITIPSGDRSEQLIANLILSVIASRLPTLELARGYIAQAHAIAQGLAGQTPTYRPSRPSKLARLVGDVDGETETLILPFINDTLVVPVIDSMEAIKDELFRQPVVNLKTLELARFMLRLRTRRLEAALRALREMTSGEQLVGTVDSMLRECLYKEIKITEPLSRANDFFILAHNLIGSARFQWAMLALRNADSALEVYMKTTPLKEHPALVQGMKQQIAAIICELKIGE